MADAVAVILAGGRSSRMGATQPKHRLQLGDRTLLQHVYQRLSPQADCIVLNSNTGDRLPGVVTIPDQISGLPGPLAGVHAALSWVRDNKPGVDRIFSVPCDSPWFPVDLIAGLAGAGATQEQIVFAGDAGRDHPVFALWPLSILPALEAALTDADGLSLRRFAASVGYEICRPPHWTAQHFFNINTPDDLHRAAGQSSGQGEQ